MRGDDEAMLATVCASTGAASATPVGRIQTLWGGYGEIVRVRLMGGPVRHVVVKRVAPPPTAAPDRSHRRKLASYAVERRWYSGWSVRCPPSCRVPRSYAAEQTARGWLFVLEDLDEAGFSGRRRRPVPREIDACLRWLATFHATFLGEPPEGLWARGTYWHLATRPEEHARIADRRLREAAPRIDARLAAARWRTLVHGDAKVANFCFGADAVAAVDFQYVGGGIGVQDLAYFLGSCSSQEALASEGARLADAYFGHLRAALAPEADGPAIEAEWRALLPFAWADFHRFLAGWAPGEHRRDGYAEQVTRRVLASL